MVNLENSDVGWKYSTVLHVRNRGILTRGGRTRSARRDFGPATPGVCDCCAREHVTVRSGISTF
jgi:hypothetical protein